MFKLSRRTLYERGLSHAQKAIVDEVQAKGQLDNLQMHDTVQASLSIVELIAMGPPISMVTRLTSSYQKVTPCGREKHEKLSNFVSRFRGLTTKHLLHANASSSSQIGGIVGHNCAENAHLEDETLTNAKLQTISHKEAREKKNEKSVIESNLSQGRILRTLCRLRRK